MITVAIGDDADVATLSEISAATGGMPSRSTTTVTWPRRCAPRSSAAAPADAPGENERSPPGQDRIVLGRRGPGRARERGA